MSKTDNQWLTVAQAASRLGISERQARRYARRLAPQDRRESGHEAARMSGPAPGSSPTLVRLSAIIEARNVVAANAKNSNFAGSKPDIRPDIRSAGAGHRIGPLSGPATDIRLSRVEGYVARDLELIIGEAVEQAVSDATAPLLERIEQLTMAHATLSGYMEAQAAAHTLLMDDLKESRKDRAMLRAELAKLTEARQRPPEATQMAVEDAVDKSLLPYLKQVQEVSLEVDRVQEENERLKAELVKSEEAVRRPQRPWWRLW
jgi:hypothetical protein